MLPEEEVRRRIVAARTLLDMSQDDMTEKGHEDYGLDKHELARVERGTLKKGIQPYHLRVLTEVLEVPMAWFTEPREAIVQVPPRDVDQVLGELQQLLKGQGSAGAGS